MQPPERPRAHPLRRVLLTVPGPQKRAAKKADHSGRFCGSAIGDGVIAALGRCRGSDRPRRAAQRPPRAAQPKAPLGLTVKRQRVARPRLGTARGFGRAVDGARPRFPLAGQAPGAAGEAVATEGATGDTSAEVPTRPLGTRPPRSRNRRRRRLPTTAAENNAAPTERAGRRDQRVREARPGDARLGDARPGGGRTDDRRGRDGRNGAGREESPRRAAWRSTRRAA
jgi:hypothetical protein